MGQGCHCLYSISRRQPGGPRQLPESSCLLLPAWFLGEKLCELDSILMRLVVTSKPLPSSSRSVKHHYQRSWKTVRCHCCLHSH